MQQPKMTDGAVGICIALISLAGVMFSSFLEYRTRERDRNAA